MARKAILTLKQIRENARLNAKRQYEKVKDDPRYKAKKQRQYGEWYQQNREAIAKRRKAVRELQKQIRLLSK